MGQRSTPALSRDGSMAIYGTGEPRRFFAVQTRPTPGTASRRLICDDCVVAWDVTSDNRWVLFGEKGTVQARDIATGRTTQVTAAPGARIGRLHLSPNDRWLVFNSWVGDTIRLIVIPFAPGRPVSHDQWIAVTPENTSSYHGAWSPDGRLLYFLSERDGNVCVWAQPIDLADRAPGGRRVCRLAFARDAPVDGRRAVGNSIDRPEPRPADGDPERQYRQRVAGEVSLLSASQTVRECSPRMRAQEM